MFATVEDVKSMTGYEVTLEHVQKAQYIIESFVGRIEAEVEVPNDKEVLRRAVVFQAAYMKDDYENVYEQVGVKQLAHTDSLMALTWENDSPFIAPLAVIATRRLSWRGSRSITTGPIHDRVGVTSWERN